MLCVYFHAQCQALISMVKDKSDLLLYGPLQMWGGAFPQRCCFNLVFSFGWKEDWQSRSICSRNTKRFLVFTNFHSGGKAAAELNEKRLWGGGHCSLWWTSTQYGVCRMKSSECQDAHWLFLTFFHQHLWKVILSKHHFKMKNLTVSLYRTFLGAYKYC